MIRATKRASAVSVSEVIGAGERCQDVYSLLMKKKRMTAPSRDLLTAIGE
jgi:hypothetical protein